jgi:hypothetical protein
VAKTYRKQIKPWPKLPEVEQPDVQELLNAAEMRHLDELLAAGWELRFSAWSRFHPDSENYWSLAHVGNKWFTSFYTSLSDAVGAAVELRDAIAEEIAGRQVRLDNLIEYLGGSNA